MRERNPELYRQIQIESREMAIRLLRAGIDKDNRDVTADQALNAGSQLVTEAEKETALGLILEIVRSSSKDKTEEIKSAIIKIEEELNELKSNK